MEKSAGACLIRADPVDIARCLAALAVIERAIDAAPHAVEESETMTAQWRFGGRRKSGPSAVPSGSVLAFLRVDKMEVQLVDSHVSPIRPAFLFKERFIPPHDAAPWSAKTALLLMRHAMARWKTALVDGQDEIVRARRSRQLADAQNAASALLNIISKREWSAGILWLRSPWSDLMITNPDEEFGVLAEKVHSFPAYSGMICRSFCAHIASLLEFDREIRIHNPFDVLHTISGPIIDTLPTQCDFSAQIRIDLAPVGPATTLREFGKFLPADRKLVNRTPRAG